MSETIKLTYNNTYKFTGQTTVMVYIGKSGCWYQFEKLGCAGVWADILEKDLYMIETVD